MNRSITVNGTGRYSGRPDLIILTFRLTQTAETYDAAISGAEDQLGALQTALAPVGFPAEKLKTTDFSVDTVYDAQPQSDGTRRRIFTGYRVNQGLKLQFALDLSLLGRVLAAISAGTAAPELQISFGLRNEKAARAALLQDAARNARETALVLCAASDAQLGSLLSITAGDDRHTPFSETSFAAPAGVLSARAMTLTPENVELSDTVTFVWELL